MSADVDVIVAGGGPVGLATAIEARMRGLTVAVVEPREGAIDKACGEGLMPGAVPALARLGVLPEGHPLRGVSYRAHGRRVDHRFSSGSGLGVRRLTLSTALAARADELGVERIHRKVDSIEQGTDGVRAAGIRGRYLVGADGLHSTVRGLAGLEGKPVRGDRRFGLRRHYEVPAWSDLIEVYWTPDVEAYVTPVAGGVVGISMLGRSRTNFDAALAGIPALAARVAGTPYASQLRGAGPFRQRTRRRTAGRVLLAGDASGYVDAITGEGIRVGLAQAEAAIDCISVDEPGRYERAWRQRTRDFRMLTAGLVVAATSPARAAIVPTAVALPRVFGLVVDRLAR